MIRVNAVYSVRHRENGFAAIMTGAEFLAMLATDSTAIQSDFILEYLSN